MMKRDKNCKVLLISSNSSGRGGGERYLAFLSRGLVELGYAVHALLSDNGYMDAWATELASAGATVHRRALKGLSQRPLRFVQAVADRSQIRRITDFCVENAPRAIVVNQQYDEDGLDYLTAALGAGIAPVAGVMHMPMTRAKNQRPLGRLRGRLLAKWYEHHPYRLIFVSKGAQDEFEAYYAHPRPTSVVVNAVPLDHVSGSYKRTFFPEDTAVVGFAGQFVAQKNLSTLIDAWVETRRSGMDSRLLLIGDGPQRAELEERLRRSAPSGTWHITGWRDDAERLLSELNVFVLTSHFEGLSLSLLEAAARGVTCVVAPFNGATDVSKRAAWVKVAKSNSVTDIAALLRSELKAHRGNDKISGFELDQFRKFFSVSRMAKDILAVLDLQPAQCM